MTSHTLSWETPPPKACIGGCPDGYAFYKTSLGYIKIGYSGKNIVSLKCVENMDADNSPSPLSDSAFAQVQEYLNGQRKAFDFPYELRGTEFQKTVWNALCDIPYGETRSYKEIAAAAGNPKASRAVGMANRKNPLWIVVPCHRVIGANGTMTGYAGGIPMKKALLELERQHSL